MRFAVLIALIVASLTAQGASQDDLALKHDWNAKQTDSAFTLTSNHRSPGSSGESEPEATLTTEVTSAPENGSLADLVQDEVADIRATLKLGDQPEENGHKAVDGIISYMEKIEGQDVGFIKYQVAGTPNKKLAHPWSVTHAILLKNGKAWFVHLMILHPGHVEEVTEDHMRMVKTLIRK